MTARPKFTERKIYLLTETQRATILALANSLPLDTDNPLEVGCASA